uniref:Retrotransposon gag domain-containing protein n=1 Tax=Nelumbo nucifera TaxID=4432 RepID=A0A822ZS63_NELNU|nr:TPA_asm: hypothetical protein HUJ06_004006 [Nelumbo nucifera]
MKHYLEEKYLPNDFQDALHDKMMTLRQGNLSVSEYMQKFDELTIRWCEKEGQVEDDEGLSKEEYTGFVHEEEDDNNLIGVVRCILSSSKEEKKEDWLRTTIFLTFVKSRYKLCKLIIDGGSSMDVVFATTVERLNPVAQPHPQPYNIAWLNKMTLQFEQRALVSISYGSYVDDIWCDVVPMNVTHSTRLTMALR